MPSSVWLTMCAFCMMTLLIHGYLCPFQKWKQKASNHVLSGWADRLLLYLKMHLTVTVFVIAWDPFIQSLVHLPIQYVVWLYPPPPNPTLLSLDKSKFKKNSYPKFYINIIISREKGYTRRADIFVYLKVLCKDVHKSHTNEFESAIEKNSGKVA